ncbi:MAG: DUF86 domain-containing protein [Bacteroidales bacterium]|nr:DUF86 domain-containing protein [Bacteroidales bacterium]
MDSKALKYLSDVLTAIEEIDEETIIRGKQFEIICTDRVYRKFVERNIGIIGEAINQVLKIIPDIKITSARRIVNTRNLVIHSYDSIDKEIIWAIIVRHLPILRDEIKQILQTSIED